MAPSPTTSNRSSLVRASVPPSTCAKNWAWYRRIAAGLNHTSTYRCSCGGMSSDAGCTTNASASSSEPGATDSARTADTLLGLVILNRSHTPLGCDDGTTCPNVNVRSFTANTRAAGSTTRARARARARACAPPAAASSSLYSSTPASPPSPSPSLSASLESSTSSPCIISGSTACSSKMPSQSSALTPGTHDSPISSYRSKLTSSRGSNPDTCTRRASRNTAAPAAVNSAVITAVSPGLTTPPCGVSLNVSSGPTDSGAVGGDCGNDGSTSPLHALALASCSARSMSDAHGTSWNAKSNSPSFRTSTVRWRVAPYWMAPKLMPRSGCRCTLENSDRADTATLNDSHTSPVRASMICTSTHLASFKRTEWLAIKDTVTGCVAPGSSVPSVTSNVSKSCDRRLLSAARYVMAYLPWFSSVNALSDRCPHRSNPKSKAPWELPSSSGNLAYGQMRYASAFNSNRRSWMRVPSVAAAAPGPSAAVAKPPSASQYCSLMMGSRTTSSSHENPTPTWHDVSGSRTPSVTAMRNSGAPSNADKSKRHATGTVDVLCTWKNFSSDRVTSKRSKSMTADGGAAPPAPAPALPPALPPPLPPPFLPLAGGDAAASSSAAAAAAAASASTSSHGPCSSTAATAPSADNGNNTGAGLSLTQHTNVLQYSRASGGNAHTRTSRVSPTASASMAGGSTENTVGSSGAP